MSKIAILGFGTVGSGTVEVFYKNKNNYQKTTNAELIGGNMFAYDCVKRALEAGRTTENCLLFTSKVIVQAVIDNRRWI
ncbi:MAG: hypothetical protein LBC86_07090 [Oscillospiraceae bacterium]|jgi:homoserine dehydrogenase|nr:hypothetical protein [Oscillospiraceae bacterium]